jgi:hypothetical protein
MRSYPNHWCGISGYLDDDRCVEDKTRQEMLKEVGTTADRILSMQRGTVLLQEAPEHGKSWLVVPVLVHMRDRRYRLDWESQAGASLIDRFRGERGNLWVPRTRSRSLTSVFMATSP